MRQCLERAEAALELRGGAAQRGLGFDIELAGQIGGGEEQIADFLFQRRGPRGAVEFGLDFGDLFGDLWQDRTRIRPVEPDPRRAARHLDGPQQRGQGERHAVEHAFRAAGRLAFGRLVRLPRLVLRRGRDDLGVTEDMRMPPLHLVRDRRGDILEAEEPGFLRHAGVEHDLQQQIAELIL